AVPEARAVLHEAAVEEDLLAALDVALGVQHRTSRVLDAVRYRWLCLVGAVREQPKDEEPEQHHQDDSLQPSLGDQQSPPLSAHAILLSTRSEGAATISPPGVRSARAGGYYVVGRRHLHDHPDARHSAAAYVLSVRPRVLVAGGQALLSELRAADDDVEVIGHARSLEDAGEALRAQRPSVLVLDPELCHAEGLCSLPSLRR